MKCLISQGVDKKEKDIQGNTQLFFLLVLNIILIQLSFFLEECEQIVPILLSKGCNKETKDNNGNTPLHIVSLYSHPINISAF